MKLACLTEPEEMSDDLLLVEGWLRGGCQERGNEDSEARWHSVTKQWLA